MHWNDDREDDSVETVNSPIIMVKPIPPRWQPTVVGGHYQSEASKNH